MVWDVGNNIRIYVLVFIAEFIKVKKRQRALDALCDVIKSKKHRTWQKIHEPIMELYLELCVDLKHSHTAKEGLYQYKNICQQVWKSAVEAILRENFLYSNTDFPISTLIRRLQNILSDNPLARHI